MVADGTRKSAVETAQKGIEAISIQDELGSKDSAEADLNKYNKAIDSTSSPDAQLLASRADALYRLEKYREAIKDCEAAIEKDSKCLLALQTCGKSFLALKEYGSAVTELEAAQAISHDEEIEKELSKLYKKLKHKNLGKTNFDEKQEGWQGPGERNTKNRAKKNEKIIKKATCGTKNEKEWLQQKWMSSEYIPNATNIAKVASLGDGYAERKFRKYDGGFIEKLNKMQHLRVKLCEMLSTSTKEELVKVVRKIEKSCNDLQNEIIGVMKSLEIDDIGFVPSYLPAIITNRCLARFDCAKNIGPEPMVPCKKETYPIAYELFEAAIEDADECIRILRFPEFLTSLSGNPIGSLFASQTSVEMNLMLINRGRSYQYLEEYELAMNDFRALCSRKRMDSPLTWYQSPTLHDATMECLNTATLIKLRDKVPRPHYTKEELEKFEKEVGLGLYSAEKYLCGFCHAKKSNQVTLRLCSRCKNAWFCSQECLKKAWKTGHKAKCKPFTGHALPISKEQVQNIVKEVKETGFSGLESTDKCWIICQENGKYFDSLSDAEIGITKMANDLL